MIGSPHLQPITRVTLSDEIIKRIVSLIVDEELKPGDKLPSEGELMSRLSVGRSSLREAIKSLRAVGVVEVVPGEGMFVGRGGMSVLTQPLSWGLLMGEGSAREVVEARAFIETELAALAAQRATDEEIAAIGEQLKSMDANKNEGVAYVQHDKEFHLAVGRAAHNRVLYHVLETLQHIVGAWMDKVTTDYFRGNPEPSLGEHLSVLEAIRMRDADGARRAMEAHLETAGGRLLTAVPGTGAKAKDQEPAE